jgi:hypothetical protein
VLLCVEPTKAEDAQAGAERNYPSGEPKETRAEKSKCPILGASDKKARATDGCRFDVGDRRSVGGRGR